MSRRTRIIVAGVVLVAVMAMSWFFLISPLRTEIGTTDAAIAEQRDRITAAQAILAQAQNMRVEGKKNQARLLELAKMVPTSSQVPSLLVQIQDLADQAGIEFMSVSPGDLMEQKGFDIIPLQLTFTGTYFDLSDFAYRVEQLVAAPGRLMTVKSITLGLDNSSDEEESTSVAENPTLSVAMTLYAFCMDQKATGAATASTTDKTGASSTDGTVSVN